MFDSTYGNQPHSSRDYYAYGSDQEGDFRGSLPRGGQHQQKEEEMKRAAEGIGGSQRGQSGQDMGLQEDGHNHQRNEAGMELNGSRPVKRPAYDNSAGSDPNHQNQNRQFPMAQNQTVINGRAASQSPILQNQLHQEKVVILDFGAQYGKVIDRRVRELNVLSEMLPLATTAQQIQAMSNVKAIIISGGPNSVYAPGAPSIDPSILELNLPILGICYGFQLLNQLGGGGVAREEIREDGQTSIQIDNGCPLFEGLGNFEKVLLTHGDSVTSRTVASGYEIVASSGPHVAGIADVSNNRYGVQFHPEVDLTANGRLMFQNFLFKIAKLLVMVSGGVDSTVCAALLHKALGPKKVTAVHIDNGFMRLDESEAVVKSLNAIQLNVYKYDFSQFFLNNTESGSPEDAIKLDQAVQPEKKRHIIGNTFIRAKDLVMKELRLNQAEYFFAQGTLRPDLIESASSLASGHADTIKTHHNDTALVRELRAQGRVIEPLKDFHKDEVRELGRDLGLPNDIVQRHPFPGPGLAIRIICAEKPYRCGSFDMIQSHLNILTNLAANPASEVELKVKQKMISALTDVQCDLLMRSSSVISITTTLLPIQSVGVQGDSRSYSYVAGLSTDARPIPWEMLFTYASIIPKLIHHINRIVYIFGSPVQAPVDAITVTRLNRKTVEKLQLADKCATDVLFGRNEEGRRDERLNDCSRVVQQMPVVMIPVDFDIADQSSSYRHSFVLRPFITNDFMTGLAAVPGKHIPEKTVQEMTSRILRNVRGTSRIMLDLTGKPPGTTEWE
ncbi:hypothetical protein WR25_21133 [Diploscapter pachys]|uniref:GMP synthase (glutamine-hydrolyzing) n=1 Tax=Diploscapter pachys TaxID=2018661 RepID=A0A2A2L9Q5_9BILA|nr:hypothetical protein WR25_21133 [Diploscapter pachys]